MAYGYDGNEILRRLRGMPAQFPQVGPNPHLPQGPVPEEMQGDGRGLSDARLFEWMRRNRRDEYPTR